jgi:hypothetical protein
MMDEEEFHNDLNSHISAVFDNYEDTNADEGWVLLRQRFPEEKKDRGLFWLWYGTAAVLLLCLGFWFVQKASQPQKMMVKNQKQTISHQKKQHQPGIFQGSDSAVNSRFYTQAKGLTGEAKLRKTKAASNNVAPKSNLYVAAQQVSAGGAPIAGQNCVNVNPSTLNNKPDTVNMANSIAKASINKQPDSAINLTNIQTVMTNTLVQEKQTSAYAMEKLLAETKVEDTKRVKKSSGVPVLSIYAATFFNYAKGSDSKLNVGAGFSSDFRISNKLKLSTGLSIAQNSLNYPGSTSSGGQLYAASPTVATAALNQVSVSSLPGVISAPTLNNYSASLIGLDIPVNLKYQFNPQKSDTYVSAGLSSGTFINETYILNYNYGQTAQQSTTHNTFSGFNLAKTLNVSFGVGYPLGKSNRLVFEPFLKYPLDGLGSQQIKFGSGGINLKLNFQNYKK